MDGFGCERKRYVLRTARADSPLTRNAGRLTFASHMKAFLVILAIVGVAVLGVKWLSEKDAQMRATEEKKSTEAAAASAAGVNGTKPATVPAGTPEYRSSLEAPPTRTASHIIKHLPPPKKET